MDFNSDKDQRPYSVLTRDGLKAKMEKLIGDLAEVFVITISDTTVLLMSNRWDCNLVEERLVDGREKLFAESGLIISNVTKLSSDFHKADMIVENHGVDDSKRDLVCGICSKDCEEIEDDDELVSTPICSHKFCITCWRIYLSVCWDKKKTVITCPDLACKAAVGPVTIEKLTVRDQEMYARLVLRSYVEENMDMKIKNCPNCENVIAFDKCHQRSDEYGLNVVCLCGFTFCFQCKLEAHRPVTCNNAADWLSRDLKKFTDSLSQSWMDTNTKPCPSCFCPVQPVLVIYSINTMLTCACSVKFCWRCLKTEEEHTKEVKMFGSCVAPRLELETKKMTSKVTEICVDRWEAYEAMLKEAKKDLKDFDNYLIKEPHSMSEDNIRMAREGLMLIIQCRLVLKWSCVYDHYHTEYENSKKEYLWFLQEHACSTVTGYLKTYLEETERAFKATTDQELMEFRLVITNATSNIGNYFYHFIKTLNEGLADVKVKSYNGVAGPYWFCDRCTYANEWIHKHCQMCVDPDESPCEESEDILSD